MSPLADPTWSAVFPNVELAGLAAQSFAQAVTDGFIELRGKVTSVTPQHYSKLPGVKASKVDVNIQTDANENVNTEIQVLYDRWLNKRIWVTTSYTIIGKVPTGAAYGERASKEAADEEPADDIDMFVKIPKIIRINLLCYNIRSKDESGAIVQPCT
jgi:hypothetical protein